MNIAKNILRSIREANKRKADREAMFTASMKSTHKRYYFEPIK